MSKFSPLALYEQYKQKLQNNMNNTIGEKQAASLLLESFMYSTDREKSLEILHKVRTCLVYNKTIRDREALYLIAKIDNFINLTKQSKVVFTIEVEELLSELIIAEQGKVLDSSISRSTLVVEKPYVEPFSRPLGLIESTTSKPLILKEWAFPDEFKTT